MTPERTHEGKWVLYHGATGHRLERWPVDAREMLASGDYTADPSSAPTAAASVPATQEPPAPLPTEYAPGVPLVVTQSVDAAPAAVTPIPTAQTSKGRRAK